MDFLHQIEVFIAVAHQGSFARAAEQVGMTRPAITNAVKSLESRLGVRLLHRTTRRTSLTAEGEYFLKHAEQAVVSVKGVQNLFTRTRTASPKGRLRVDMTNSLGKPLVIPRLAEFKQRYPEIDLVLGVSDKMVDLVDEGVDCVLRVGEPVASSMVGRVLGHVAIATCASANYVAEHGKLKKLEEIANHPLLAYYSGRDRRVMDWQFTQKGERVQLRVKPDMLVNDHEALVSCVLNGMGISQLVGVAIQNELARGELVEVLPKSFRSELPVSILYPARQHLPAQVRVFVDWCVETFSSTTSEWLKVRWLFSL